MGAATGSWERGWAPKRLCSPDTSRTVPVTQVLPSLNVMMPAPDRTGDLYVGGEFSFYNGVAAKNIVRINRDGSLD